MKSFKKNTINDGFSDKPTEFQKLIARKLGVKISKYSADMAAAIIHDYVANAILDYPREEPTDPQYEFADKLRLDISDESRRTAKVVIKEHLFKLNQAALKKLKIKPGDTVTYYDDLGNVSKTSIVSTIKPDGKIYFKGTNFHIERAADLIKKTVKINAT